jgi:glycosyltransferase involved in cell wall biosynthesis
MKKKIVIASDCFLPRWDGIARFLKELLPYFSKEFDVTVLCPEFPGKLPEFAGVHIHRYPLLSVRFGDINFAWAGYQSLVKHVETADLVFSQTLGPVGLAAIKAAKKNDIPLVGFVHSLDWELASRAVKYGKWAVGLFVRTLVRRKYNKFDVLLTPSQSVSDALFAHGVKTRMVAIPLGVDTATFLPATSKADAKKRIGIDPKTLVVGFCGRIGREKDLPTLIKAFRRIQHKHDVKLLIVGKGIESIVTKNPRIILTGTKDNVVPYLQAMDVFVLPSLTETSSLATMEAMACGLPVIATPVGSIKEYIEDGVNGFTFPRQDIDKLSERLSALLKSPAAREAVGIAARKTIEQRAAWENSAKKIMHVLHELTN